jgi:murein DD-endopeptidase MepM/ murein hydrolase activator NlpD
MRVLAIVIGLVVLIGAGVGVAYVLAGNTEAPKITIHEPAAAIGQSSPLALTVDSAPVDVDRVIVSVEQGGKTLPVSSLNPATDSSLAAEGPIRVKRTVGKKELPELQAGKATIVVQVSRTRLMGLRTFSWREIKDVEVRFEPPKISVVSMHHYINQGGAEFVVYRATPPDVMSGVRVGMREFPGFPASGAGVTGDDALKVAFFAIPHDETKEPTIELFARDTAGNEAKATFDHRVFPKKFKQSRIPLDDSFLSRVVPAIVQESPELKLASASAPADLLPSFLKVNGELRRLNAEKIAAFADKTAQTMLWSEPFRQLGNSKVESGFADDRTYVYGGKQVDRQTHLGFDLSVTANVPVLAANRGKVLSTGYLGIYGNCVIVDHGLGVQSLYAHLSSIDVRDGEDVREGQQLGRSGQTGLAGGDHLHFTMLVDGQAVNPTEWWDPHWVEDRVMRKLREAGAASSEAPQQ